ncbi:hypothetical protein Rhe02_34140 [Rhizocola hellebori]|uniref:SEFIR domain-containing protein n=1 Tax=Rhizocola hellebori TaxID=1392758 RepID=A0A8J3Q8W3_9ACTN|nr:toll/interleukin-1 receptor domain-containing protein [Rhizocola hellebori]GIH05347.1 hypothetical protein Rhe02_34140 [Rhizocola hellebori]
MPPSPDPLVGDIPLYLADETKSIDSTPSGIALGMIRLWAWQLYRLHPLPRDLSMYEGYLVRINYEFDIALDVPAPVWAEVQLAFPENVIVVDALPRAVHSPERAYAYRVNGSLNFVRRDSPDPTGPVAPEAALPAAAPHIECFGVGGNTARWRHTGAEGAGIRAGSHVAWLVLLTPPGQEELAVLATGQYRVEIDPQLGLAPVCRPDAFSVRLPQPVPGDNPAPPVGPAPATPGTGAHGGPRVFISYSQDPPEHSEAVEQLWHLLKGCGADVRIDKEHLERQRNWSDWTTVQILRSDYTIVVASPAYLAASEDQLPAGRNLGIRSEYVRLADLLHRNRPLWTMKILPVVLPGRSVDEIPLTFLPGTVDHHIIHDFTPQGAASLLRTLGLGPR